MTRLTKEIAAYEKICRRLENNHRGEWAVMHDQALVGLYPTLAAAMEDAKQRFGNNPYLIRNIGGPQLRVMEF